MTQVVGRGWDDVPVMGLVGGAEDRGVTRSYDEIGDVA